MAECSDFESAHQSQWQPAGEPPYSLRLGARASVEAASRALSGSGGAGGRKQAAAMAHIHIALPGSAIAAG